MVSTVRVHAPASVANVGCGFDMMGFAVDGLGDNMILRSNTSEKITISRITGDQGKISQDPMENCAGVAIKRMLESLGEARGVDLEIHKLTPVGSGLGSSASSTTAAVVGLNELLGRPFSRREDLIPFALEGERLASGGLHADNVAPCLLGGMLVIRSIEPLDLVPIPVPPWLLTVLVHPALEVLTKDARAMLRTEIPMADTIAQMANVAAFVMSMVNQDTDLMKRSFEDRIAEPYRAALIPGYYEVKAAALANGAIACSISGSGPTVFAFVNNPETAYVVSRAMQNAFASIDVCSRSVISAVCLKGTLVT